MKYFISTLMLSMFCLALNAQKGKSDNSKYKLKATISNGKSEITSNSKSYKLVFPQSKGGFNPKEAHILTNSGEKLKMGDEITTNWSWDQTQSGSAQPTAYGGTSHSVSTSVTFGNGGRDVTISTTTSTTSPDGSTTSETQTTTIKSDGTTERTVTVTNGQGEPTGNGDIIVIVE